MIDLKNQRVHLAGVTTNPDEAFSAQIAPHLTDIIDGFLTEHRLLIRDRKFSEQFPRVLKDAGFEPIRCSRRALIGNAYAERFALSIQSECLGRMIFCGEGSRCAGHR